jgi:hypothetical protein
MYRRVLPGVCMMAALFASPRSLFADPDLQCPDDEIEIQIVGTTSRNAPSSHAVPILPCQTFELQIAAWREAVDPLKPDVAMTIKAKSIWGTVETTSLSVRGNAGGAATLPRTGGSHGSPIPSTLDPSLKITMVEIEGNSNTMAAFPITYEGLITLRPRPGYNKAGLTTATATPVKTGDVHYATMASSPSAGGPDTRQYFRVRLFPGGKVTISGSVTNQWTSGTAKLMVDVQNLDGSGFTPLTFGTAPANSTVTAGPISYTNTGTATKDYYLALRSNSTAWVAGSTLQFEVNQNLPPGLRLKGALGTALLGPADGKLLSATPIDTYVPLGETVRFAVSDQADTPVSDATFELGTAVLEPGVAPKKADGTERTLFLAVWFLRIASMMPMALSIRRSTRGLSW